MFLESVCARPVCKSEASGEEGDEAVGVGACKVSVFFRVARSAKRLTLYPSHSYTHTHKQATHRILDCTFFMQSFIFTDLIHRLICSHTIALLTS